MMRLLVALTLSLFTAFGAAQDPIVDSQVRVSTDSQSRSASETTGAATADGREILSGFVDFRPGTVIRNSFSVSSDGGKTWTQIVIRPPLGYEASTEADPMSAYDPRTNTLFAGGISAAKCIYIAKKVPGQNAFGPSMLARIAPWPDKGWMAAGPRPGLSDTTRLYITYNEGIIWSDDLGSTWESPHSLGQGYGFLPRVGPEGVLFLTYWDGYWGIKFTKSLDGGQTWSAVAQPGTRLAAWGVVNYGIPGTFRNVTNNAMAVNPVNGDVVIMWVDQTNIVNGQKNLDLYLVRSTDKGATWSNAKRLPFRPMNQISDMIFPWIEFTKDGRLHLFAMDTSHNPGQTDGAPHGLWDQVYYYSDDLGASWSQPFRLTSTSWDSYYENSSYSFLGDYQGMAVSDRSVYPVYPDTHTSEAEAYVNRVYNPIEMPTTFAVYGGALRTNAALSALFLKDASALVARPVSDRNGSAGSQVHFEMIAVGVVSTNPAALSVSVTSSAGPASLDQKVSVYNISTLAWDVVDTRAATQVEATTTVGVVNPENYILPETGTVRWRISFKPVDGQGISSSWTASVNQTVLLVVP